MTTIEIILIAVIVCINCSLLGTFLMLKKMTMMSDAITHTIILGIILTFFLIHDLSSPLLILGASLIGILTVWLTEMLKNTHLMAEDSSIGIIFPLLFSIAIILITKYSGSVHLDTDSVLLGELAFAPFQRFMFFGIDIGPKILVVSLIILISNCLFIFLFFKELKLAIFDSIFAKILGFAPVLLNYLLMVLLSITTVASFEAVGSILVVAFVAGIPVTSFLITVDLKKLIFYTFILSIFNAIIGCVFANIFDVSIAGSIAMMIGITFFFTFLFSPKKGIIKILIQKSKQRKLFEKLILLECIESNYDFDKDNMQKMLHKLVQEKLIKLNENKIYVTRSGKRFLAQMKSMI